MVIIGNRAVITTQDKKIGVYLHWNGGRDSVEAFLKYCELRNFRSPSSDNYGWARLVQIISNYIGSGLSIGIDKLENLDCDNYDNGTYIIKDWKIVDREFKRNSKQNNYDLDEMVHDIDRAQPLSQQIFLDKDLSIKYYQVQLDKVIKDDFFQVKLSSDYDSSNWMSISKPVVKMLFHVLDNFNDMKQEELTNG